jgi:hypothetical protein
LRASGAIAGAASSSLRRGLLPPPGQLLNLGTHHRLKICRQTLKRLQEFLPSG